MVYFLYFIVIISFFDTFSQLPIIAPYASDLGGGSLLIGLVIGIYSFSNMIGNVLSGPFTDRSGRKRMIVIGMALAGASLFLYSFAASATQLLWIRFLHGIGGGLLVPAIFAYLGDRSRTKQSGKTMAHSGAAIGGAAVLAPAFGGIMTAYVGIEWVFNTVAIVLLVTAFFVHRYLPDEYQRQRPRSKNSINWKALIKNPHLQIAYLSAFGLMFTLGVLTYTLPLKVENLGFSTATTGLLMSIYGVVAICIFLLPTNRISDQVGRIKPLLIGLFSIAFSLVWLAFFSNISLLYVGMIWFGVGFALLFPAMNALVIDQTQPDERGTAFGLFYAFFSLGVVLAPFLIGFLRVSPDMGMMIGSLCLLLIVIIVFYRSRASQSLDMG